jgi:E3 ubiquitin-protein ligase TRIP12
MEDYITLVTNATLLQNAQALSFRQGLEILLPSSTLELFTGEEMEDLLCGQIGSPWKMADLQQYINPDHGFTANSSVFQNLLITMSEFSLIEQRKFLQFLTGSPRLPVGGFSALNPRLTVVRKEPSMPGMHADEYLPSVMTCQNYLKLPEYSCIEVLQRNLKYAVNEGHESFHLS